MIKVVGLKKNYGRVEALKSISFEVDKGSVFGFIGRNGAGKTTTMNILTGLIKFNDGKILIKGKDFQKNKQEILKSIGYLPETPTFYDYMNAYEYLRFIGKIIGYEEINISKLLEMVQLAKQKKKRIGAYSRGMKQRLALAVAFMGNPEILFLDEPASALDPEGRMEMLELIEDLKDEKIKENGRKISIYVKDMDYAKKEILKELSKLNTSIVSYQIRKSTLEDIFMRMVK